MQFVLHPPSFFYKQSATQGHSRLRRDHFKHSLTSPSYSHRVPFYFETLKKIFESCKNNFESLENNFTTFKMKWNTVRARSGNG